MKRSSLFVLQLLFTLLVCAFMLVPVLMSLLAGLTRNFFVGLSSGLTFDWLIQVWQAYSPTVWLSLQLALAGLDRWSDRRTTRRYSCCSFT